MTINKLEKVLETCSYVYENSKHVKIDINKVKELAKDNRVNEKSAHWLSSNPYGILDLDVEDIINFLVIYDSIDCSFWGDPKWTINTAKGDIDGAIALMYALLKLREHKGNLDFEKITFEEFSEALKGNVEIPLLEERYKVVSQVSKVINQKMQGNFYHYIKNITKDIVLFNTIINNFPSFEDIRTYDNKTIYFYKLAQLLTSDILHIRSLKEGITVDCSNLVGCADYKIPQVLRGLGILVYDKELSELVNNKKEVEENSTYEVEIRAGMIVAINLIKKELKDKVSAIDINDIIWSFSQDKTKKLLPYHLTRTLSY